MSALAVSVIVPVYNGADYLRISLPAIVSSPVPHELIVVNDGSTDESVQVAEQYGARVVHTSGRCGPAVARNLGADQASSNLLLFIDADVRVHADTLSRVVEHFNSDPQLSALMGSYDQNPYVKDFVSKYRNLMHAFFHRTGKREASTFWSGCGAIRRDVFVTYGGFSSSFGRPAIEDIELGYRLKRDGHKLLLDPAVEVQHLKRWSLLNMITTDVFDRGIPWTELILRSGDMPNDLNTRFSQRVSVLLAGLLVPLMLLAVYVHGDRVLLEALAVLGLVSGAYWTDAVAAGPNLLNISITLIAMAGGSYWGWTHGNNYFVEPLMFGYLLLLVRRVAPLGPQVLRWSGIVLGVYFACIIGYLLRRVPQQWAALLWLSTLLTLLAINWRFYWFLGTRWGWLHALAAIPIHVLYFLYCGVSFGVGFLRHTFLRRHPA